MRDETRAQFRSTVTFPRRHLGWLAVVLVSSAGMFVYWSRVTDAVHASPASSAVLKPKLLTDFYPSWYATRELLLRHRDPYGPEVNRELQIAYYGKELDPSRAEERRDQQRFVYPLYFVMFVAPLVWFKFRTAQTIFGFILAGCAVLSVILWLWFVRPRLSPIALTALFGMVLSSIPILQNLSILQPFLVAACLIAGAAVAIAGGQLFLAGTILAIATVKPQICILPLAWIALWVGSDWKARRLFFFGFAAMLAALLLGSEGMLPGWSLRYPGVLKDYAEYTQSTSFLGIMLPGPLHWLAAALALILVAKCCWRVRRRPANSPAFVFAFSLVLALSTLIIPALAQPFNHMLLLPAVLLAVRYRRELGQSSAVTRAAVVVFSFCALLPWLLAVLAIASPFDRERDWLLRMWSVPLAASMALPFAAFGALILLRKLIVLPEKSRGTEA